MDTGANSLHRIFDLWSRIDRMNRTPSAACKMDAYRSILKVFYDSTGEEERNRKHLVSWLETNAIGERLFPNTPVTPRQTLLHRCIDAMILDDHFHKQGFCRLEDPTQSRGFECLVMPEKVKRNDLFVWDEEKVDTTWVLIRNLCDIRGLHWVMIKDFSDTVARLNDDAASYATRKRKTTESECTFDLYKETSSIYRDMFRLPQGWAPPQVASYVHLFHQKRSRKDDGVQSHNLPIIYTRAQTRPNARRNSKNGK